jgi:hypothetical protein
MNFPKEENAMNPVATKPRNTVRAALAIAAALAVCASSPPARADAQPAEQKQSGPVVSAPQQTPAIAADSAEPTVYVITGTYIPRKIKRHGFVVDTPFNVTTYDRDFIERSGTATVEQLLQRDPAIRILRRPR